MYVLNSCSTHGQTWIVSFPGSLSSANVHNMAFDPVEILESKVVLCAVVEEGEPRNKAKTWILHESITSPRCDHQQS